MGASRRPWFIERTRAQRVRWCWAAAPATERAESVTILPSRGGAELLTINEMARADSLTIASGTSGAALMEAAGGAVATEIMARWQRCSVVVLCGPGNNGGDGFVAACRLRDAGWPVKLVLLGSRERLAGDAAQAAARWHGPIALPSEEALDGVALVVDALFGAGLTRPLDGTARHLVETVKSRRDLTCIAVDVPSGVHGDTGQVLGAAIPAALTVTFFRRKPGHLLLPGRSFAGTVVVADIGISPTVIETIRPRIQENRPDLWLDRYPWPRIEDHKYRRGHAVIVGGATMTGAARLAARAARRVGAGLVTIACPPEALAVYAGDMPGLLTRSIADDAAFGGLIADERKNVVLVGPGTGVGGMARDRALAALRAGKACVLDADALTAFETDRDRLFRAIRSPCLMTPHEGEFERLFPSASRAGGKVERARAAARESGAALLLKGADTVISHPDGRALINSNAPPNLATAGTGDILAGFALGLFAQGMAPFDAAAAAAWLQGAAAESFGPGLIAEDLPDLLPTVLRRLKSSL